MFSEKKITTVMIPTTPSPRHSQSVLCFICNLLINLIWALPWFVGVLYLTHKAMGLDLDAFWENVIREFVETMKSLTLNHV